MDPDTFLKSVNQPSTVTPLQSFHLGTPVPSVPPPQPLPALPAKKGFFGRHWIFYTAVGVAVFAVAAGAGAYYYYVHRAYSESEVLALIRKEILPSVVQVYCADKDGGEEAQGGSGVYFVDPSTKTPTVLTNAHVVLGSDGLYHGCNVYFPRPQDGSFYDSIYMAGDPVLYHNVEAIIQDQKIEGMDYALLPLTKAGTDSEGKSFPFPPVQKDIFDAMSKACPNGNPVNIGDKIFLIGYPQTGGESISLTQGVVSGFQGQFDEWVEVSAGITHGNSGGLAIGATNGCDYGIPSQGNSDGINTVGLVLSSGYISSFLNGLTGKNSYVPPAGTYTKTEYRFHDFLLQYPADWEVSTSSTGSGVQEVIFSAPIEGALDQFQESLVVRFYPNGTEGVRSQAITAAEDAGQSVDSHAENKYVSFGGKKSFYEYSQDDTLQNYPVSVVTNEIIPPLLNGTVYALITVVQNGPRMDAYTKIMGDIIESVRFAQ